MTIYGQWDLLRFLKRLHRDNLSMREMSVEVGRPPSHLYKITVRLVRHGLLTRVPVFRKGHRFHLYSVSERAKTDDRI